MIRAHPSKARHDGWTGERRQRFLELLAAGLDVRRACAGVGQSRQAADTLRRRDPLFAPAWEASRQAARERAWLATMPEWLRVAVSEVSGERQLRGAEKLPQDTVRSVARV